MINIKKLTRSQDDKVFSGVLGGIGEYLNVNPVFLRIVYVLLTISSFFTMTIIYILSSAIIPLESDIIEEEPSYSQNNDSNSFLGISLIVLGVILLANNFFPVYFPEILSAIRYYSRKLIDFWPVLFIILGIYLLLDKKNISK